jgi:nucleoside-diphosphate-sugar epimerase
MPSILITGSSGFIGGRICEKFSSQGWNVTGIGRRELDQPGYVRFDLSQPFSNTVSDAVRRSDVVLHAAARSSPWGSRRVFYAANVEATERMVEACEKNGKPKLVYISSSSVYYQPEDQIGLTESSPQAKPAVNLYAETKQVAEQCIRNYSGCWSIVRPRAVYGKGDTVLFPRILAAAKAGKLPLLTRPGNPAVGDLISIENLVEYLFKITAEPGIKGEYNLTDNDPVEIIPFLLNIFERLGIERPKKQLPVKTAFRVARAVELLYGTLLPWIEPPITRFGVHVFAYSKTFDVSRMINDLGPPKLSTKESVERFVSWVQEEDPYRLK